MFYLFGILGRYCGLLIVVQILRTISLRDSATVSFICDNSSRVATLKMSITKFHRSHVLFSSESGQLLLFIWKNSIPNEETVNGTVTQMRTGEIIPAESTGLPTGVLRGEVKTFDSRSLRNVLIFSSTFWNSSGLFRRTCNKELTIMPQIYFKTFLLSFKTRG